MATHDDLSDLFIENPRCELFIYDNIIFAYGTIFGRWLCDKTMILIIVIAF